MIPFNGKVIHLFAYQKITIIKQQYFTISEEKGYVLLCQHLDNPSIDSQHHSKAIPIEIPNEHSMCPWPYIHRYLVGNDIKTNNESLRKEHVLKALVEKVSNAMNEDGFDNHTLYNHSIQFRKCIDNTISEMDGTDKKPFNKMMMMMTVNRMRKKKKNKCFCRILIF